MSVVVLIALGVGTVHSQQPEIPSWIKFIADLWADDKTSDEEFVSALRFLINADVIQVDNTVPLDDYDALVDDYDELYNDYDALYNDYDALVDDYNALRDDYSTLYDDYNALRDDYSTLYDDYNALRDDYTLYDDYNALRDNYSTLYDDYNALRDNYSTLYDDYNAVVDYYDDRYPLTIISGTEVHWKFYDSKGNFYTWSMPISTFEDLIQPSRDYSLYQVYDNPKYIKLNGLDVPVPNFDGFVRESFSRVVDGIYDNSHSNSNFVHEVWYIVSQLTVYDEDVTLESEGRYALETFTRTGGDCEDLVILIADMLMSSSHTSHWEFQYVLMDSDNPLDPQDMNHVILYVYDGQYAYHIEATAPPSWDYYPDGVIGWSFDVV